MQVAVVGLGLIGGSMALELKGSGFAARVVGVEADPRRAKEALARGLVSELTPLTDAAGTADLVILAAPVDAVVRLLPEVLSLIRPDAVVMDVGSTKQTILAAVQDHPARTRFVATHPMAGSERSGPAAAHTGLFAGRTAIMCDRAHSAPDAVQRVADLYTALGMNRVDLDAAAHDRWMAFVSHAPHALAYALVRALDRLGPEAEAARALAGTGFASVSRLAQSPPEVWAPIFLHNREALLAALDAVQAELTALRDAVARNDSAELRRRLDV